MQHKIYEKIREALEKTPGLTQRGLAEHMGLDPAAVNRMLYGRRNIMADEIPIIEDYIGIRLNLLHAADIEYRQDMKASGGAGVSDVRAAPYQASSTALPVYAVREGALFFGETVDYVQRHPLQFGIRDAFALYVFTDEMEPRYMRGEIVYLHPHRPPEREKDCIVEMKDGRLYLRRYLSQSGGKMQVLHLFPEKKTELPLSDVKAIYAVVGRG